MTLTCCLLANNNIPLVSLRDGSVEVRVWLNYVKWVKVKKKKKKTKGERRMNRGNKETKKIPFINYTLHNLATLYFTRFVPYLMSQEIWYRVYLGLYHCKFFRFFFPPLWYNIVEFILFFYIFPRHQWPDPSNCNFVLGKWKENAKEQKVDKLSVEES